MANIVDIKKYMEENNQSSEIKKIFELVSLELKKVRKKYWYQMEDDTYELLENNFKNIKSNIDYDKWLPLYNQKKFINAFNNLHTKPKQGEDDYYELYDKVFLELELIAICNLDDYILNNDVDRIKIIVKGIAQGIDDIDLKFLPRIVRDLSDRRLDKYINDEKDLEGKRNFMADISSLLSEHLPLDHLLSIKEEAKNKVNKEEDNLDNGILTINRVKNYYLSQANYINNLYINMISQLTINDLKIMDKINDYDYDSKDKFLDLVRFIRDKNEGIVESVNYVGELTHLFIVNSDNIKDIDMNELKTMLELDHVTIDDRISIKKK